MNINKRIIAFGVSVIGAGTLAVGGAGMATAAETPPASITTALCDALPDSVSTLVTQVTSAVAAVTAANTDLTAKQAALTAATNDLVAALVTHVETIDAGGNSTATGQVVGGKAAIFSDKLVAETLAMNAWFEAQRTAYLANLSQVYVSGLETGLCD